MATNDKLFLHDHPYSGYAQKVRIALREKKLPFDHAIPAGLGSGQHNKSFSASNPREEAPALVDGDTKIFDSTIILEYLEDKFPEIPLLPPRSDPAARARARMIEEVCDTHYDAVNWGYKEVVLYGRGETEGVAERLKEQARLHTRDLQAWLEEKLGDNDYFNGTTFGWADVAAAPVVHRSITLGLSPEQGSPLERWHARVLERPSVQETLAESDAAGAAAEKGENPFKPGKAKREYRDHRVEWLLKAGGISIVESGLRDRNIRFSWPRPDPE